MGHPGHRGDREGLCAEPEAERAREASGGGLAGGRAHGSYGALLADPEVDAIYNSLPNALHHDWTIQALEAGKHVLCEKPIASNAPEAERMFDAADRAGRLLVEAFMYRAHPAIDRLVQTVQEGTIGRVKLIRANFTFNRLVDPADARYAPGMAGGSIMDVGCYCVHLARAVVGSEPAEVNAICHMHELGVDEYAAGTLRFEKDVLCVFTCGMTVTSDLTTYICGDEGYIAVGTPWFCDGRFTVYQGLKGEESHIVEVPEQRDLWAVEADAFAAAVRDGVRPWISREDTLGNMRTLDALRTKAGLEY
jgi:predicted dehydrogenase